MDPRGGQYPGGGIIGLSQVTSIGSKQPCLASSKNCTSVLLSGQSISIGFPSVQL